MVLQHGDDLTAAGDTDDAYLFRRVLQQSDLWLQTTSLSSQTRGEVQLSFSSTEPVLTYTSSSPFTADPLWWTILGSWIGPARRPCSTSWRRQAPCFR